MKKFILSLAMMLICFAFWGEARAQEELVVHEGDATNSYVPVYGFYGDAYLKCEMVYPAGELADMNGGSISAMTFYLSTPASDAWTGTFQVFLSEVGESSISSFYGPGTIVYEGLLDGTGPEMTVQFETPYIYGGSNLLVGFYLISTGNYKSAYFLGETVEGASVQNYSYTSLDAVSPVQRNFLPMTNFAYTPSGGSVCDRPSSFTVDEVTEQTAQLSFTGGNGNYHLEYKVETDETWISLGNTSSNSMTLTNLASNTTYQARVQCVCASGNSSWRTVSFTTTACAPEAMCEISYALHDSYGDGWNGNAIHVVDAETGGTLASWTIFSGSEASGTLAVCDDIDIRFEWASGSYANETSYVVYDVNGEEIFSGSGVMTEPVQYHVDCTVTNCKKPSNFAVASAPGPRSVELVWTPGTNDQNLWEICLNEDESNLITANTTPYTLIGLEPETTYTVKVRANCGSEVSGWSASITFTTPVACPKPTPMTATEVNANSALISWNTEASAVELQYATVPASKGALWLQYDDDSYVNGIGYNTATNLTWGVMYPASMFQGNDMLTKVSIYEDAAFNTSDITINIYSGGDDAPGTLLYTETVTPQAADAFHEITLNEAVVFDQSENLWITLTEYGTFVINYCASTEPNNQWILNGGSWSIIGDLVSSFAGDGWMIRGFIEPAYDPSTLNWISKGNVSSPYRLTGLSPETNYVARVKANCGSDLGQSEWTYVPFTTLGLCDNPTSLTVSNVGGSSAVMQWQGAQTSYNVRYRERAGYELFFSEDFDGSTNLPTGWTIVDNDGDGYNWEHQTTYIAHSGEGCISSASYINNIGALTPDNWLITPHLDLQGTMSVWMRGQDPSYAVEHFAILLSTTTTDLAAFDITLLEGDVTDEYVNYTADLSNWAGQQGYIAIRHYNVTDMYWLNVDDFTLVGDELPAGDWQTAVVSDNSYTLQGLAPTTTYECQVQGICENGLTDWTDVVTFTTTVLCPKPSDDLLMTTNSITYNSIDVTWYYPDDTPFENFDISYHTVAGAPDEGTIINATSSNVVITGLAPATTYYFYVRNNCGSDGTSQWLGYWARTTSDACSAPTNLVVSDVTNSSAVLSWTENGEATVWDISVNDESIYTVVDNPFLLENLEPSSAYLVKVRSYCDDVSTSAWSSVASFNTLESCPSPTDLTCVGVTNNSAILTWTENGSATSWQVSYSSDPSFDPETGTLIDATSNMVTITGLTPEVIYYAMVRANCDGEYSGWSLSCTFEPTEKILVSGSETSNSGYLPTYPFYNYSLTQQIYTANDINTGAGTILAIDFFNVGSEKIRNIDLYLVNTTKNTFESTTDWVPVTSEDLVFSGEVTFVSGSWTSIVLDVPFNYGGGNMVVVFDDNTGTWQSGASFQVFAAPSQALRIYSDPTDYDPMNPTEYTGTIMDVKNSIRLLVGEPLMEIHQGWNWVSAAIEYNETSLDQLRNALVAVGDTAIIKSQTQYTMYENGNWYGDLTTLDNAKMYVVDASQDIMDFQFDGDPLNPEDYPITINPGWNWIPYLGCSATSIYDALSNMTVYDYDVIKSKLQYGMYMNGQWFGLEIMEPGMGYMYMSNTQEVQEFTYPACGSKSPVSQKQNSKPTFWRTNDRQFATNLIMTVTVDLSNTDLMHNDYEIGAFVNGECRGAARLVNINGNMVAFLTVSGNDGDKVFFKLYDADADYVYPGCAVETIVYKADDIYGDPNAPMTLHFGVTDVNEDSSNVMVFPNPTNDKLYVSASDIQSVMVFNAMGQCISSEEFDHAAQVELNLGAYSAGVYTIAVRTHDGQLINRMVVKK